jgi:RsbT co-antagonist protein rsbRD N-terminal domain
MAAGNLSKIVDDQIDELKKEWLAEVRKSEYLTTYKTTSDEETVKRAEAVYSHLSEWLKEGATNQSAEEYFEKVGSIRFQERFPLTEVHYAVYLLKKIFWNKIDWRDKVTGAFETTNATKIMNVFNDYFDLANFSITKGYFNELLSSINDDKKLSKDELKNLLTKGKLNPEVLEDDEFIWRHV